MANAPQLDSILARRFLRDTDSRGAQSSKSPSVAMHPAASRGNAEIATASEDEIAHSIRMIERAAGIVDMLQDTIAKHEETIGKHEDAIYALNGDIAEASRQKDEAFQEVVKAEQMIRAERERALRAEARASSLETRVDDLERQNGTMATQLDRLMKAINMSLSRETASAQRDGDLKLVS